MSRPPEPSVPAQARRTPPSRAAAAAAAARYERIVRIVDRGLPVEQRGDELLWMGKYEAAARSYRDALAIYRTAPTGGRVYPLVSAHVVNVMRNLGTAYERSGRDALARRTWAQMPDAVPAGWEPRDAERLVRAKQFRGAFGAYDAFLFQGSRTIVSPVFADAGAVQPLRDALSAGANGHFAEARRFALDSLQRAPNFGYARLILGVADAAAGDRRGAAREWIAAIEASPPPTTQPERFDAATLTAARLLTAG